MSIHNVAVACALVVLAAIGDSALASAGITDEEIKQLLQIQGGAAKGMLSTEYTGDVATGSFNWAECTQQGMDKYLWKPVNEKIAQADYGAAMVACEMGASTMAACALRKLENHKWSAHTPNFTLPEWAAQIGSMLTFERINMQNRGFMETDKSRKTAERAMTFLVYAQQNGASGAEKSLAMLKDAIGIGPSTDKPAISATAEALVAKFTNNSFGFDQQYIGKTIEAVGTVRNISGSRDKALVTLLGNKKKSKDDLGWQDEITCVVSDQKALQAAAELEKGKTYKVRGIYKNKGATGLQITLSNCEILK